MDKETKMYLEILTAAVIEQGKYIREIDRKTGWFCLTEGDLISDSLKPNEAKVETNE